MAGKAVKLLVCAMNAKPEKETGQAVDEKPKEGY